MNRDCESSSELRLSRRTCLKTLAFSLAAAPAWAGAAEPWQTKAQARLKMAVDARIYSHLPVEEAAARIKADGFSGILTDYTFGDVRFDPFVPDWQAVGRICSALEKNGIEVAAYFGYYNVVDPDPAKRERGRARMEFLISNWKRLSAPVISTETGTYNRQSEWLDAPENTTEEAYLECRGELEKLARLAEKAGAVLTIEPYWRNIIDSIERAERLFKEVNSPGLKLVMDPCNYFRKEDLPEMQPMLKEMLARLGKEIVVAHAKDVKAAENGTDLPAAGLGELDYPLYLRLLAEQDREMFLILEHLTLADMPRARQFVLEHLGRKG